MRGVTSAVKLAVAVSMLSQEYGWGRGLTCGAPAYCLMPALELSISGGRNLYLQSFIGPANESKANIL